MRTYEEQSIEVPLKVGSHVTILTDVDIDEDEGSACSIVFSDTVTQHVPDTRKLSFEDSDIGYAEFQEKLQQHDSIQILRQ